MKILKTEKLEEKQDVYCLTTPKFHNFLVKASNGNNYVTHNCAYCSGWNLRQLLEEGFGGVKNRINSLPAKHLNTAIAQIVNFLGTLQNCWAGAQAFNSFDTYLAPFVKKDDLSDKEIRQCMQEFCWDIDTEFVLSDSSKTTFAKMEAAGITEANVLAYDIKNDAVVTAKATLIGKRHDDSEMLKITLNDGSCLKLDPEQRLLTKRGWVMAKDLTEEDNILEVNV